MIPLRVVLAIVLAMATAVVALAQLNLPTREFWQAPVTVGTQWASVSAMAAFILVNEVRTISHLTQAGRIRQYDLDLRAALSVVLCSVVQATGANWAELTVCYYRARGLWRWRKLVRVGAVMLGAGQLNAPLLLRPREGLVGMAFSKREIIADDWAGFVNTAIDEGVTVWDDRDEDGRYGLKWGQLRLFPSDTGAVASPTFDRDGTTDGCLLVSGPFNVSDVDLEFRRILNSVATALEHIGPPPRGWWRSHEH